MNTNVNQNASAGVTAAGVVSSPLLGSVSAGQQFRNTYDGPDGPTITIACVDGQEAVCVYRWYDHAKNPLHAFVKTVEEILGEVEKGKWLPLPNNEVSHDGA